MDKHKIYFVTGASFSGILVFKYHLNGDLAVFELQEAELDNKQRNWLFSKNFPYYENQIDLFRKLKEFDVKSEIPTFTFDDFYTAYNYKVKRVVAERAWKKLTQVDKMNAVAGIKKYDGFLHRKVSQSKANPATYLNQRYWEDEYGSL